jgi:hypothetical protein
VLPEFEEPLLFPETAATAAGGTPADAPVDGGELLGAGGAGATICENAGDRIVVVGAAA